MATAYAERIDERVDVLGALVTDLRGFPESASRGEFTSQFEVAQAILELQDEELAELFQVSRPTIGRWRNGEAAPHPIGRKAVFNSLAKIAKDKLKALSRYAQAA